METGQQGTRWSVFKSLPKLNGAAGLPGGITMRRLVILAVSMMVLGGGKACAQEGIGHVSDISWQYFSWLGLGASASVAPHTVLSMSAGVTEGFLTNERELGTEWAASVAYRFKEKGRGLYLFAGYRQMSVGENNVGFTEAGIGYHPPDSVVEVYPELSVLVPQVRQVSLFPGATGSDAMIVKVPVIVKLTIRFYFDPSIPPFWENSDKK